MQARPLQVAVALVAASLAGLILHFSGMTGALGAVGALTGDGDAAGHPASALEATVDSVTPTAVTGRTWTSTWPPTLLRAATLLTGLLALAALLTVPRRSPAPAWHLVRPDRALAITRHSSPLAAGRAPPAPAGR